MKTGLVYLRPKHVVCYRAFGPLGQSGPQAWGRMIEWLDELGIRDEAGCGYGIASSIVDAESPERSSRYDACIELPPSVRESQLGDMQLLDLPGGAHVRRRYVGPFDGISRASREFRTNWLGDHGLCADRLRPLVEIYLDDPKNVAPEKLRVDLCFPVAVESLLRAA